MIKIFYLILDFNKETHSEFPARLVSFLIQLSATQNVLISGNFLLCGPLSHPSLHNLYQFVVSATDIQFWFSKTIRGVATNLLLLSPSCRSLERAGIGGGGGDIKKIWIVHHFQGNYLNKFFRNAYSQETRIV